MNNHTNRGFQLKLRANESTEVTLRRGEPLVLRITLIYSSAIVAGTKNLGIRRSKEELETRLARKEITNEEYERQSRLLVEERASPLHLGSAKLPWYRDVIFFFDGAKTTSARRTLDWPIGLLSPRPADSVDIDMDATSVDARFGCPPDSLPSGGTFEVFAALKVPSSTLESNVVSISFTGEPADKNNEELHISLASLYLGLGQLAIVETEIKELERVKKGSTMGAYLRGQLEEIRGNFKEALSWYEKALKLFEEEFPDAGEYPELIISSIGALASKIARSGK